MELLQLTIPSILRQIEYHKDAALQLEAFLYAQGYRISDPEDHWQDPVIKHHDVEPKNEAELWEWMLS